MIRDIREQLTALRLGPLTCREIAERSGLHPSTVWRALQRFNNPRLSTLEALERCGLLKEKEKA